MLSGKILSNSKKELIIIIDKNNEYPLSERKDPLNKEFYPDYHLTDPESVVSANECTGMVVSPPLTEEEVKSYNQLYETPLTKSKQN